MNRFILYLALGLIALCASVSKVAHAQVPQRLSYQGVLTHADGTVFEDGIIQLRFRVYLNSAGTPPVQFEQTLDVDLKDGIYNVILSDTPPYTLANAFSGQPRYMEVALVEPPSTVTVMLPRQEIASVPYALNAARALAFPPSASAIPLGGVILWIDTNTCPPGFAELEQFNNRTIRGADLVGAKAEIPDAPNRVCDASQLDAGCGTTAERYNDALEVAELAPHQHTIVDDGDATGDEVNHFDAAGGSDNNHQNVNTESAGGGLAHLHPFATVLFCRFEGYGN